MPEAGAAAHLATPDRSAGVCPRLAHQHDERLARLDPLRRGEARHDHTQRLGEPVRVEISAGCAILSDDVAAVERDPERVELELDRDGEIRKAGREILLPHGERRDAVREGAGDGCGPRIDRIEVDAVPFVQRRTVRPVEDEREVCPVEVPARVETRIVGADEDGDHVVPAERRPVRERDAKRQEPFVVVLNQHVRDVRRHARVARRIRERLRAGRGAEAGQVERGDEERGTDHPEAHGPNRARPASGRR